MWRRNGENTCMSIKRREISAENGDIVSAGKALWHEMAMASISGEEQQATGGISNDVNKQWTA